MILATDLDGTFLAGSEAARTSLVRRFLERPDARLVYVTGRSVRSVLKLVADGRLPPPDAMVCDVGTMIADSQGEPDTSGAMDWIIERWQGKAELLGEAMKAFPALELQPEFGPHRLGYYYRAPEVVEPASAIVRDHDCDPLASDNLYFDVLPRGVNKGTTLSALVKAWGAPPEKVLVAGDTLNDQAMLEAGFPAVAVGGSEPALLERLAQSDRILRAPEPGCDGILAALDHFKFEGNSTAYRV